jgi:hypothetical protein
MFELKLSDGKVIPLKWGYYAMKRFGKRASIGAMDYFSGVMTGDKLFEELDNILFCAAEFAAASKGEKFTATEVEVSEWIDDVGGIVAGGQIMAFFEYMIATHSVNLTEKQGEEEKKN